MSQQKESATVAANDKKTPTKEEIGKMVMADLQSAIALLNLIRMDPAIWEDVIKAIHDRQVSLAEERESKEVSNQTNLFDANAN